MKPLQFAVLGVLHKLLRLIVKTSLEMIFTIL